MTDALNPKQEEFARLYYAGPDHLRGNGRRCYLEAYGTDNPQSADTGASRLLRKEKVRARIEELRREAAEAAKTRARDWWELYPQAQETLRKATAGELPGDDQDKRSAVEAAKEIVSRCLGSVKIQHEHAVEQRSIVVQVAGAPHPTQEGYEEGADALPSDSAAGGSGRDSYEEALGMDVTYTHESPEAVGSDGPTSA